MKYRIKNARVERSVIGLFNSSLAYCNSLDKAVAAALPFAKAVKIVVYGEHSQTGDYCEIYVLKSDIEEIEK